MSLNPSNVNFSASAIESNLVGGLSEPHGFNYSPTIQALLDGTGAGKAQKVSQQILALTTTPLDIDLTACPGGPNNANINFSKVKWLFIENIDVTNIVRVGGVAAAPTNAWTNYINGTFDLGPATVSGPGDQSFRFAGNNGWVVDATHKLLRLVALAGTPSAKLFLVGEGV